MKYKRMVCWVTKTHEKILKETFAKTHQLIFSEIDELFLHKNCIFVISLSKITNKTVLNKIKKINNPYFLEKKGWMTSIMSEALENSDNWSMIGLSDIQAIIK
jgi:predicted DNA-binding protein (MmcQ/YjbR family)